MHNERCTPGSVRGARKPLGRKAENGAGRPLYEIIRQAEQVSETTSQGRLCGDVVTWRPSMLTRTAPSVVTVNGVTVWMDARPIQEARQKSLEAALLFPCKMLFDQVVSPLEACVWASNMVGVVL